MTEMACTTVDEPGIHGPQAAKAAGVTYRRLDYWTRIGYLSAEQPKGEGSGNPRLYSEGEIRVAAWLGILCETGMTLAHAAPIARDLEATGRARFGALSLTFEEAS